MEHSSSLHTDKQRYTMRKRNGEKTQGRARMVSKKSHSNLAALRKKLCTDGSAKLVSQHPSVDQAGCEPLVKWEPLVRLDLKTKNKNRHVNSSNADRS